MANILEYEIKSIGEMLDLIINEKDHSGRILRNRKHNNYVFRGLSDKNKYELSTSVKRTGMGHHVGQETDAIVDFQACAQIIDPRMREYNFWELMVVAQHYGLPTRLMDWTYSPLIALHFATIKADEKTRNDAIVWAIDVNDVNLSLPDQYQRILKEKETFLFTLTHLVNLGVEDIQTFEDTMKSKSFLFFEPPSINQRIFNQDSVLALLPENLDPLDDFLLNNGDRIKSIKFNIPKEAIYHIRDQLDLMSINERFIYPGLDGIAKWMKRRYFIKGYIEENSN